MGADASPCASLSQLLPTGRESISECWNDFPEARDRLLRTLMRHRTKAPIVVSGDVHYAELMEARCGDDDGGGEVEAEGAAAVGSWWEARTWARLLGLPSNVFGLRSFTHGSTFVELTTSGLTHSWRGGMGHNNGEMAVYMTIANAAAQYLYPWRYQTRDRHITKRHYFLGENFGEVEVDWEAGELVARALRASDGSVAFERSWPLTDLDMRAPPADGEDGPGMPSAGAAHHRWPFWRRAAHGKRRPVCIPHRGEASVLASALGKLTLCIVLAVLFFAKPLALALVFALGRFACICTRYAHAHAHRPRLRARPVRMHMH